jgi:hypothetical protein
LTFSILSSLIAWPSALGNSPQTTQKKRKEKKEKKKKKIVKKKRFEVDLQIGQFSFLGRCLGSQKSEF